MSAEVWYHAVCQDCTPVLPQPFTVEADRDAWADTHERATKHFVVLVTETRERTAFPEQRQED